MELSHECSSIFDVCDELVSDAGDVSEASKVCLSTTRDDIGRLEGRDLKSCMSLPTREKMRDVGGYRKFRAGFAAMMGQVQSTRSRFAWEPGEEGVANSFFSGAHFGVADIKENLQPDMGCVEKSSRSCRTRKGERGECASNEFENCKSGSGQSTAGVRYWSLS